MVNDFEEFALQFRRRTAARLLEFEKNLTEAQHAVERGVFGGEKTGPSRGVAESGGAAQSPRPASRGNRQVKGVLRRG